MKNRPLNWVLLAACVWWLALGTGDLAGQESPADSNAAAEAALNSRPDVAPSQSQGPPSLPIFDLFRRGGGLMVPIVLMSIVVVAVGVERSLGLRNSRVLPEPLVTRLGQLADSSVFDPRSAFQVCAQYPSSASRVIQAMLLKVGRPHSEVEKTVADASQRETDRLFANVRTLNLAAAVTPLLGLLGTVWGMIQSFFATSAMGADDNRVQVLSEGIYVALVTTFAGLSVAIPAAMLAHFFEGRILRRMHEVEALADALLPQVERYEGKLRLDRQQLERVAGGDTSDRPRKAPVTHRPSAEPSAS
jgi:biopolymer transport protein ExbB